MTVKILVLQHDADDPPLLMGDWLAESGALLDVRRCFAGDETPTTATGFDAVISMGGAMGAREDEIAPWLPAARSLLAAAVADNVPTLGICLGAQLLATATGGTVTTGTEGPEIGAYLAAKRDAADDDPLFGALPMTPDVMQYHYDVISTLPPGAVLLLSSTGYPHQAFRVGETAWGVQFHFETSAADLREWARAEGIEPTPRLGPLLDDAAENMGEVWRSFTARFVDLATKMSEDNAGNQGATSALAGRRIPLAGRP